MRTSACAALDGVARAQLPRHVRRRGHQGVRRRAGRSVGCAHAHACVRCVCAWVCLCFVRVCACACACVCDICIYIFIAMCVCVRVCVIYVYIYIFIAQLCPRACTRMRFAQARVCVRAPPREPRLPCADGGGAAVLHVRGRAARAPSAAAAAARACVGLRTSVCACRCV